MGMKVFAGIVAGLAIAVSSIGVALAAPLEKASLKIGLAVETPAFLPVYLAQDQGIFKAQGLDVQLVTFRNGADLARAMISGAVDMASGALVEALVPIQEGQPLKVFYAGMNNSVMDWYAVKSINSIADAKGKRFGIASYGSLTDFVTRYALHKNGLDPQTDVKIVAGGSSSARLAAMDAGQLDVNLLIPPAKFIAAEKGYNKILSQSDIAPDYPYEVFYAPSDFLSKNPETVKAFLRAFSKGADMAKSNRDLSIQVIEKRTGVEAKYAALSYDEIIKQIYADGRLPSAEGMKSFWDISILSGSYTEAMPESAWLDRTFLDSYAVWSKQ